MMERCEYTVEWSIDLDADSPWDAAIQAWEMIRDPESQASIFFVTRRDVNDVTTRIDVLEPDEDARYLCNGCGRIGNADDGISADGDECPDEECGGTVHRIEEEV
jgi:hypothetical protein